MNSAPTHDAHLIKVDSMIEVMFLTNQYFMDV